MEGQPQQVAETLPSQEKIEALKYVVEIESLIKKDKFFDEIRQIYLPEFPEGIFSFSEVKEELEKRGYNIERTVDPSDDSRPLVLVSKKAN